jgi:hypothetical protein
MKRISKGFLLFQKGNVELIFEDEGMLQFNVKSGKIDYLVSITNGVLRCDLCQDFEFRFKKEAENGGALLCKHAFAALFKLGEIKGIGTQSTLEFADKKVKV